VAIAHNTEYPSNSTIHTIGLLDAIQPLQSELVHPAMAMIFFG